ncbi:MAG: hypothetical protein HFE30_01440 [Clostridiales bacterium]|nr:hypothetical protein [Clostridiales bacterium]
MKFFSPEVAASKLPIKFDFSPKYRYTYYDWGLSVFSDFDVDNDEMNKWLDEAVFPSSKETGHSEAEPPEMYIVSFIKYFHISKEEFERVCAERRAFMEQMPSYDVNGEDYELPNPDIIYTFDNDIINEYYLRETCTYVD